jgi:hypothetical protein
VSTVARPFPAEFGPITGMAVELMKNGQPKDFISVERMSAEVGRDCSPYPKGPGYGNVLTAIKHVRRLGIVWAWDTERKGWACLDDKEKAPVVESKIRASRRRATVGSQIAATTNPDNLEPDERTQHFGRQTVLALLLRSTAPQVRKKISERVESGSLSPPSANKLLELFKKRA